MGNSQNNTTIEEQYDIIKLRQDGSALLHHKKSQQQFLLRTVCSSIGEQVSTFEQILRKRQQIKSPHLLDLVQIRRKQQKNVCSSSHKMYLLIEYPFKTIKDQIVDKISKQKIIPFLEAELWSILYSCCMGLNTLYEKKMPHQSLTTQQIYINKDGLIKISDPILLGTEKNYIKVLKNNNQHAIISPQIINFLDDCNFSFYDKQKSDVFILGAIMLQASLLRPIQLFDQLTKKPFLEVIPKSLNELKQKYSQSYLKILQKMLQLHSKLRPQFSEIIATIQQENNLYESTDETSVHNRTKTNNSYTKFVNQGSNKTLSKSNQNQNLALNKNGILNVKTANNIPVNSNLKETYHKKFNQNEDQTIIKILQTQNLLKTQNEKPFYAAQSGISSLNQQIMQQPTYVYSNTRPLYVDNFHGGYNNFLNSQPNFVQTNFIQSAPNNCSQINNSQPPSARFNQSNDRFSYTKFGNITLDNRQTKQKPIFSYQIPEINQILKNQNSGVNYNFTKPKQNFNKSLNPQTQNRTFLPTNIQATYNQSMIGKPYNNDTNLRSPNTIKTPKQQSPFLIKNINQYQQIIQVSNNTKSKIPQLNFEKNSNYSSPINVKATEAKGTEKLNSNKISLNGILKQNEQKTNQIFAVTQKSQQNLETSPAKNIINSNVKLNEPQRSPGPISLKSSSNKPSSNEKSNIKSHKQDEEQIYVIQIIDGGGKYEGYIKNGQKNGQGKLQFNDGGYYAGQWKDNKMHGYGRLHYQNGQVAYEGNWQNDQFSGFGRVFNDRPQKIIGPFNYHDFADLGEKWIYYEGQFKNDSKHGKGKIRLTNGEVFEGNFIYDSIEGDGIFYSSKGQAIRGNWKDNMLI